MISLELDDKTNDLIIKDNIFIFIDGVEDTRQTLKTRLQTFQEEFFYDASFGVPYIQTLGSNNGQLVLDLAIKNVILSTPNIDKILKFQTEFDTIERLYTVNVQVKLDDGNEMSFQQALTV